MKERHHRTTLLLGSAAAEKLHAASVTVVGLGAVGSFAVEGLARAGVGHLHLIDHDHVHPSNLNRQLYALHSTIGASKCDLARARVLDINPDIDVRVSRIFLESGLVREYLPPAGGYLIDAIDTIKCKIALLAAAHQAGLRLMVASMGAARRTDPLRVQVGDLSETHTCRLAQQVRKGLRAHGITTGIRCVYSLEPPRPDLRAHAHREEAGPGKAPMGSLGCVTGVFGLVAAREIIMDIVREA